MKPRELAARYGAEIGCNDNSCMFGPPGGMATNGGCRCLPRHHNLDRREVDDLTVLVRKLAHVLRVVAECTPKEQP